jgi:hypothetical protein
MLVFVVFLPPDQWFALNVLLRKLSGNDSEAE